MGRETLGQGTESMQGEETPVAEKKGGWGQCSAGKVRSLNPGGNGKSAVPEDPVAMGPEAFPITWHQASCCFMM